MSPASRARARSLTTFLIGLSLLAAALWAVAGQRGTLEGAWGTLRGAEPWKLALLLALPLANVLVVSAGFWVQTRRLGPVGFGEMAALIGMAWLLNYVPLRVGMATRVAYHRAHHGIPIAASARVMLVGAACGGLAMLAGLAAAALVPGGTGAVGWAVALALPAALGLVAAAVWRPTDARPAPAEPGVGGIRLLHPRHALTPDLPWVFLCRYADFLIWVARYALVFDLIGRPISLPGAVALAAVCQVAINVPLAGNGMGLREWAIGLSAAWLPPGVLGAGGGLTTGVGLAADLLNRAAEIVVSVPVGVACILYLVKRRGLSWGRGGTGEGPP